MCVVMDNSDVYLICIVCEGQCLTSLFSLMFPPPQYCPVCYVHVRGLGDSMGLHFFGVCFEKFGFTLWGRHQTCDSVLFTRLECLCLMRNPIV